jgi:dihydrodiol dehydrogenase / D-xylose 1-dehydrogenase (NADP)
LPLNKQFFILFSPIDIPALFFNGVAPDTIKITGQVDKATEVDLQAAILLSFPATGDISPALDESNTEENTPKPPGSGVAILSYGILGESEETTTIVGTKGRMTIETPCHCPTTMKLRIKAQGRGSATEVIQYNYPLPSDTEEIIEAGGYYYINSAGFCYEAAAVARCIAAGKTECPQYTLSETLMEMKILDEAQKQLSLKTIYDE